MAVKKVPEGHNRVSPYLSVDGGERALEFYKKAFGAVELFRHTAPTGKVGHAEVRIGDTVVMLADVHPDFDAHGPAHYGGSPISLHMYVEDVDAVARQAIAADRKSTRLNSSHLVISYAVFCLKKKKKTKRGLIVQW